MPLFMLDTIWQEILVATGKPVGEDKLPPRAAITVQVALESASEMIAPA